MFDFIEVVFQNGKFIDYKWGAIIRCRGTCGIFQSVQLTYRTYYVQVSSGVIQMELEMKMKMEMV